MTEIGRMHHSVAQIQLAFLRARADDGVVLHALLDSNFAQPGDSFMSYLLYNTACSHY